MPRKSNRPATIKEAAAGMALGTMERYPDLGDQAVFNISNLCQLIPDDLLMKLYPDGISNQGHSTRRGQYEASLKSELLTCVGRAQGSKRERMSLHGRTIEGRKYFDGGKPNYFGFRKKEIKNLSSPSQLDRINWVSDQISNEVYAHLREFSFNSPSDIEVLVPNLWGPVSQRSVVTDKKRPTAKLIKRPEQMIKVQVIENWATEQIAQMLRNSNHLGPEVEISTGVKIPGSLLECDLMIRVKPNTSLKYPNGFFSLCEAKGVSGTKCALDVIKKGLGQLIVYAAKWGALKEENKKVNASLWVMGPWEPTTKEMISIREINKTIGKPFAYGYIHNERLVRFYD
jgi:hypothetical protein